MENYTYSAETGEYTGTKVARQSPMEPGVYLTPGYATPDPPPSAEPGNIAIFLASDGTVPISFRKGTWQVKQDNRGQVYYMGDDTAYEIDKIGEIIPPDGSVAPPLPTKTGVFDDKLIQIDGEVTRRQELPFVYGENSYYPDHEFISGMYSVLPDLPADYTEEWKTSEKEEDGLNNVYVVLDKDGIKGLALAYLTFRKTIWAQGDAVKKALKVIALDPDQTYEDLANYDVLQGW